MRTRFNDWDTFIDYEAKQWRMEQRRLERERFEDNGETHSRNVQEPSESLDKPQDHDQ